MPPRTASGAIVVQVTGEVCSEGTVVLPEGGTVLEAINAAGGFTDFAMPYRHVKVRRGSEVIFLSLRDRKVRTETGRSKFHLHRVAWYIATPWEQAAEALEIDDSGATTDYVLLQSDIIDVPRCAAMQ
ncbi:MAG: SLBB domain-containing protein [Verrucomicrobiales bacterium]|nr:SLBB domain-containing protein [Verrucomicrobiales bacterium]